MRAPAVQGGGVSPRFRKTCLAAYLAYAGFFGLAQSLILLDPDAGRGACVLSLILSAVLCLLVVPFPVANRDPVAPPRLLALFLLVFFPGFSALYLAFSELGKWYLQYFPGADFLRNLALANALTVVALPLFLAGFLHGEATFAPGPETGRAFRTGTIGTLLIWLAVAIGFAGMLAYAQSIGGIRAVLDQMESIASRRVWREVASKHYYLGMVLMTGPAILALAAIHQRRGFLRITAASVVLVLAAALLMVTQASREKAVFPLILFAVVLWFLSRAGAGRGPRLAPRLLVALAILSLAAVFAVQTVVRSGGDGLPLLRALSDFNRVDISMVMFVDYFDFSSGNGFLLGGPLLAYPNQILVRLFGAAPVANTSEILHRFIFAGDPNAGNPGAPLVAELYMNFGFLGYVLFPLAGAWFGRQHARLFCAGFAFWPVVFYSTALYFFVFKFCVYTGLSESILMLMLVWFPLLLWRSLIRLRL